MQAIVQTILNSWLRFFDFLRFLWNVFVTWINYIWASFMLVLDALLSALASVLVFALQAVTDVLLFIIGLALAILPNMPEKMSIGSIDLGGANRYLPISETVALAGVWAVIFGGIGLYKLAKFVRGAG